MPITKEFHMPGASQSSSYIHWVTPCSFPKTVFCIPAWPLHRSWSWLDTAGSLFSPRRLLMLNVHSDVTPPAEAPINKEATGKGLQCTRIKLSLSSVSCGICPLFTLANLAKVGLTLQCSTVTLYQSGKALWLYNILKSYQYGDICLEYSYGKNRHFFTICCNNFTF